MKTKVADRYYTPEELSALVKVPVGTLKYWRQIRYGPKFTNVGRRVRYPGTEVDQWLEDPDTYQDARDD
jgi:DNA-binding transcriptional MerR regulator